MAIFGQQPRYANGGGDGLPGCGKFRRKYLQCAGAALQRASHRSDISRCGTAFQIDDQREQGSVPSSAMFCSASPAALLNV
jgi:hypothetical protein